MPIVPSSGAARGAPARRALALAAAALGLLGGCNALGGGGGVMPATEVGLPPSMRGAIPGKDARTATTDADGRPLQTAPTRQIALPKDSGAAGRTADAGDRRIRRDEIEGSTETRGAGSSMAPTLSPGGSVGLGGKF